MSLHRESEMFSYWQRNGNYGLRPIIEQSLGQAMVDQVDHLARNAYLTNPYAFYGDGSATGFSGITTSHKMSTDLLDAIQLGIKDRKLPWAAYNQDNEPGSVFCIASPGSIYDLKREVSGSSYAANQFVNISQYANGTQLLNGEIGTYRGVRFVESSQAILWNAGTVTQQTTITAAVAPGDGAPDPATTAVDSVRYVGQAAATHYITVTSTTGFSAGDIVTVHKLRHNGSSDARGVTNGLDYTDPMAQNMKIHEVVSGTRLSFTEPYMMTNQDGTGLETDLGGTVYGYITKGRNIHTAMFMSSQYSNGVVAGVAQPPRIYTPPAVDDYQSIFRISYDMWLKYALWEPQTFEVAFLAGSNKDRGSVYVR